MKFAFSTVACPTWDLSTLAARAKSLGYDGVEIRAEDLTRLAGPAGASAQLRASFAVAGVSIACLSCTQAMSGSTGKDQSAAAELLKALDLAAALGCGLVKIPGPLPQSGRSLTEIAGSFARWLAPLADTAAERNIILAVENTPPFRRAREIWTSLEALNYPAVAAALDPLSAALAGESPAVSVPVLNSRLGWVAVTDARVDGASAGVCRLGEGNIHSRDLFNRLRGVGYNGWISFNWPKSTLASLADAEQVLPEALAKMRDWTTPKAPPKPARPEVKKPAAPAAAAVKKPAPAPAAAPAGA